MGRAEPQVGLEGKFSVQHCISIGLIDGAAFPAQFSDAKVSDSRVTDLRRKVKLTVHQDMAEDACRLVLTMKDGAVLEEAVEHATGSPQNPLTDERLVEKFMTLAAPSLGEAQARTLLDKLWSLEDVTTLSGLVP